jgi:acetoin:2,6-dichlorophenolindophenol oxidoreductase subunit beta
MPDISYREAIRLALRTAMQRDESVVVLGEDIGASGGPFKITEGLIDDFGPNRIMDTPISETGFVGASIGLALAGFRPVAELMFADFAAVAFDQIVNEAAKYRFMSAGQMPVPMVVRCGGGAGGHFAAQHSQTTESWYLANPGLKVVVPSNPQDAYGLLLSAIADDDPVIYIEHRNLYSTTGPVETDADPTPIGSAAIVRPGRDVTVVASLAMVPRAVEAAEILSRDGIEVEVVDVRSLAPLDIETITESVRRTSRLATIEEQSLAGGWGGNVVAEVVARSFEDLDAPPIRIGLQDAPIPFSPPLEEAAVPTAARIAEQLRDMIEA